MTWEMMRDARLVGWKFIHNGKVMFVTDDYAEQHFGTRKPTVRQFMGELQRAIKSPAEYPDVYVASWRDPLTDLLEVKR